MMLLVLGAACNPKSFVNDDFLGTTIGAPPVGHTVRANNLNFTLNENASLNQSLSFTSSESSAVVFEIVADVSHGSLTLTDSSTGTFQYTPVANWTGQDSFTYKVTQDNNISNVATVSLNVVFFNNAPSISSISNTSTNEDTSKLVNFTISDVDSTLSCSSGNLSLNSSNTSVITNAAVVWGGTAPNCTATITPVADANGSSTITVTVTDGSLNAQSSFVLTVDAVNDAPVISTIANTSTNEDTAKAVSFTVTDVDSTLACSSANLSLSSSNTSVVPTANVVWSGSAPNCVATITPAANANGTSTIGITVSDGSLSASRSFVLTVNAVNNAPTIGTLTDTSTNEDTAKVVNLTVSDIDSTLNCSSTNLSMSSSNTAVVPNANVVWSGSVPNCVATITPALNANGTSTITVTVTDGSLSSSESFILTINAVNDSPVISAISDANTNEDVAKAINVIVSDVDSPLTCSGTNLSMSSSNTALIPNANVVWSGTVPNCVATITPALYANGTSNITMTVSDGSLSTSESFVLTVNAVNNAPTISTIADTSTNEDTAKAVSFTIDDVDSTLTCSSTNLSMSSSNTTLIPTANVVWSGTLPNCTATITPALNAYGTSTLGITVTDGSLTRTESFVLTVNSVNDAPVIAAISDTSTNEDTAKAINVVISDVDSTLSCSSTNLSMSSSYTTLVPTANVVWSGTLPNCVATITPAANANGTSTIGITVSDGSLSAQSSFVLTVNAVNDAPAISTIADTSTNEDTSKAVTFTILDVDSTLACSSANLSMISSDTAVVPTANVVWSGTAPNCTATISPAANANGATTITITVTDGSLTAQSSFILTVNPVNDLPTMSSISDVTVKHSVTNSAISFSVDEGGGSWEDYQTLSITGSSSNTSLIPNSGIAISYTDNGSASADLLSPTVTLTPTAGQTGTATITLTVTDNEGASANRSFVATVVHPAPTLTSVTPKYARQGQTITLTGNYFYSGMTVGLSTLTCGSVNIASATSATCVLPTQAKPILADVKATNTGGQNTTLTGGFLHLGNPKFWVRADALTGLANNDSVTTWTDQSTSGFNATNATAAQKPLYKSSAVNGLPAIYFDGSDDKLTLGSNYIYSATGGLSTVVVLNSVADRQVPVFVSFGFGGNKHYAFSYDVDTTAIATPADFGGGSVQAQHTLGAGNPYVVYTGEIIFNSLQRARLNGTDIVSMSNTVPKLTATEVTSLATANGSGGPFTIGMQSKINDNVNRNINGNIAEILVYTEGTLTATERKLLECYMSIKYAINLDYSCN